MIRKHRPSTSKIEFGDDDCTLFEERERESLFIIAFAHRHNNHINTAKRKKNTGS